MAEWICTDPDSAQWQRKVDGITDAYDMWQVNAGPEWKYYYVSSGTVFVDCLDSDDLDHICNVFGYDCDYLAENPRIFAESYFEHYANEFAITDYGYELKHPRFKTFEEAELFIKQQIGMEG